MKTYQQPALILPRPEREALQRAAAIRDPHERMRALEEAIERAKRKYPQLFQPL